MTQLKTFLFASNRGYLCVGAKLPNGEVIGRGVNLASDSPLVGHQFKLGQMPQVLIPVEKDWLGEFLIPSLKEGQLALPLEEEEFARLGRIKAVLLNTSLSEGYGTPQIVKFEADFRVF